MSPTIPIYYPYRLINAFSIRYLGDDDATQRAFDEEGYYRTGDILRQVGEEYVFEGRASADCRFLFVGFIYEKLLY